MPAKNKSEIFSLYGPLMSHFLHQDKLMWDFAKIIIAVQGATFVIGWSLRPFWLGWVAVLLGAAITLVLLSLVKKAEKDRDANLKVLDLAVERALTQEDKAALIQDGEKSPFVRLSVPAHRRGENIIKLFFLGFVVLDFVFAALLYSRVLTEDLQHQKVSSPADTSKVANP